MRIEFNKLKKARNIAIDLCKTNGEVLHSLANAVDKNIEIMLNGLSELSFKVYKNEKTNLYYDEVIGRKYVKVENVGLFIIKNVTTENDGITECKQVDCVSAEFELASKNMGLLEGTYKFYDPSSSDKSLMNIVLSYLPNWKIGQIEDDLWNIYRTFDIKDNNIYNFLMSEVQDAYQCVFIFDTINRTISAKTVKGIVRSTDIFLSNRNLVKSLSIHEDSEEVKTALDIYGDGDLSIHSVNPIGTATLYDFSYYKSLPNMMSKELISAIDKWEAKKAGFEEEYKAILKALKGDNDNTVKLESELKDLESELNALEDQQAIQVAAGEDLTEIAHKIKAKKAEIEAKKREIVASGSSIEENKKRLKEIAEDLKFQNNFSQELIKELSVFIIQATHQCTNFGVTDEMNENEKLEVIEQLKAYGEEQLKRVSQPTYTFDIDVINFTKLIKYKKFIEQLELGSEVTICVDRETDKFARVLLMGYSMSLDSSKDIQLHFSNKLKFGSDQYTWEELINQSTSVSTTVDFESPSWSKAESANSKIDEYINAALDLTQKEIISSDNQEFTLTRQGLRGREWNEETQSYLPEQLWMTKNVLAFSDNGFTGRPRMALGKTLLPDGTYGYGLIAEQLVGNITLTKKLVVENENHSFKVDGDSILIKNANIIMNNDGTSNEDKTLEDLLEQAMTSGGNVIYRQPEPPTSAKENDLWFDTDDNNKPYVFKNGEWVSVRDTSADGLYDKVSGDLSIAIGQVYEDMESMKQAIEDGEMVIYYQETQPSIPPAKEGDLWYDTTLVNGAKKNEAWIVNKGVWNKIKDNDVINALDKADQAQITADGKIKTYWQPEPPKGLKETDLGDLWFDTNDKNKLYRWSGSEWVDVQDKTINDVYDQISNDISSVIGQVYEDMDAMKQAIEDGEMTVYYQSSKPEIPPAKEGDLWYDTTLVDGKKKNEAWIVNGGIWQQIKDSDVANALDKANQAQITADGKIKTYWQTNQPTGLTEKDLGDLWFDVDDNNKLYRWDGREWIDVQDKTINQISQDFADSIEDINNQLGNINSAIEDGVIETYYQPTDPMLDSDKSPKIGDLWFDTKNGKLYRHNGGNSLLNEHKESSIAREESALDKEVNYKDVELRQAKRTILQIDKIKDLEIQQGGSILLPGQILGTLSDGVKKYLNVNWDKRYVDINVPGIYFAYGTFMLPDDILNPLNLMPERKIIVAGGTGALPRRYISKIQIFSDITIEANSSYTLPKGGLATLSDGSPLYMDISWNTSNVNTSSGGTYTVYGDILLRDNVVNTNSTRAVIKIIVTGGTPPIPPDPPPQESITIAGVENPSDLTIEKGGSYSLPSKVIANLSNGGVKYLNVNWDDNHVDTRVETTYIVYGDFVLDGTITNPKNIRPTRKIIVGNGGSGTADKIIVGYESIQDITINKGERYTLPEKVAVNLEPTDRVLMNVVWSDSHVNTNSPNTYTVYGEFQIIDGNITNPQRIQPNVRIIVKDTVSPPTPSQITVTGVEQLAEIKIQQGGSFQLPSKVLVQLSNSTSRYMSVAWNRETVNVNIPNTYTVYGDIQLDVGVTNPENIRPSRKITVLGDTTSTPTTITSVEKLSSTTIEKGGSYSLPSQVLVSLSTGGQRYMNVSWKDSHVDVWTPNTYTVYGDIALDVEITNPLGIRAEKQIIVRGSTTETLNIIDITNPQPIVIQRNGELNLPKQVQVKLSNSSTRYMDVSWDTRGVDTSQIKSYTVYGTIQLQPNITNNSDLKPQIKITIQAEPVKTYNITKVNPLEDVIIAAGNTYKLPKTVTVQLSNQTTRQLNVLWKTGSIDIYTPKTYPIEGDILLESNITNSQELKARVNVVVKSGSFSFWDAITDKGIIQAIEDARNAQTTADGKISTYYTSTKPTQSTHPSLSEGDLWIDTDDGNRLYRYSSGQWVPIRETVIDDVINKVDSAIDSNGNINADKMIGQILAGKSNIICASKGTTGNVVTLNENGIIVATRTNSGAIDTSRALTCITREGIVAEAIKANGTLSGLNIVGGTLNIGSSAFRVDTTGNVDITRGSINMGNGAFSLDSYGNIKITKGSINIGNGAFSVSSSGDVVAKSITLTENVRGDIDANTLKIRNLIVGENVLMGNNVSIKWGNLPEDVAGMSDIPTDSEIQNIAKSQIPSYITSTKITRTEIESPTIKGGILHQYSSRGGVLLSDGTIVVEDSNRNAIGSIYYNSTYKMYIMSDYGNPMRIESGDHMAISVPSGKKINLEGHVVIKGGKITDENGNSIAGGSTAVFG